MRKYLSIIFLFSTIYSFSQVAGWQWERGVGAPDNCGIYGIKADHLGNIYEVGYFNGIIILGSDTLRCCGNDSNDIFIAKYDSLGNIIWAKRAGGRDYDYATSIAIDDQNNIYVTGTFMGTSFFDNDTLFSNGLYHVFIAKYNTTGILQWVIGSSGTGSHIGNSIACDKYGGIYITGFFKDSIKFENQFMGNGNSFDIFVAKFNSNGSFIWAKQFGSTASDEGASISTDGDGSVYFTGSFASNILFDTYNLFSPSYDFFLCKMDSLGNVLWAKQAVSNNSSNGSGIATDSLGNSYITGYFMGTSSFDNDTISSIIDDIFVTKYSPSGNEIWVKKAGGSNIDIGTEIALDKNEKNLFITGYFDSPVISFGNFSLNNVSPGTYDLFIAKYDTSGNNTGIVGAGGNSYDTGESIDVFGNSVYVGGCFMSAQCIFGNDTVFTPNTSYWNIFLAKYFGQTVLSINNINQPVNTFAFYPNPFSNATNLQISNENNSLPIKNIFELYDVFGRKVRSIVIEKETTSIDREDLSSGIYFYRIISENKIVGSGKLIAE